MDGLIKLFGTTIVPVPEAADAKDLLQCNGGVLSSNNSSSSSAESDDANKETTHHHQQEGSDPPPQPEVVDAEDPNKPAASSPPQQQRGDGGEPGHQQGKPPLKKPDKVLPCPRCNSMDTKFCYFNNYNVNQPRHFCKNCQRYWTAGGAMRNVPVGAGRRKNKSAAASQFLQRVRAALPADPAMLKANCGGGGTVLSFGHAEPQQVATHMEKPLLVPVGSTTPTHTGNNKSCSEEEGSSSTDDKNQSDKVVAVENPLASNGVVQQQHPAANNMWPYYPPGIAFPIFPSAPAYWGCMVPAAGGWSLPWPAAPPQQGFSSPTCSAAPSSVSSVGAADSLTLGKHARDDDEGGRASHHGNGKVWAPKTIRIDDADEVAKSSIWSLVGARGGGDKQNTNTMHGLRKGTVFEPRHEKTAKQAMMITSSPLLHANPVALTRSLTFQEGS